MQTLWRRRYGRHDAVKTIIANALATIESTDVRVEPRTLEGRRRNDISTRGRGISDTRALDYDIKIYSLHDADSLKTTTHLRIQCLTDHWTRAWWMLKSKRSEGP